MAKQAHDRLAPEQSKETLIFLATAGVVVPLFRRLKVSPVLGFLGAGVLLGPYGLGALARQIGWLAPFALDNVEQIAPVAEFGIVFLLFMLNCRGSVWRLSGGSSSGSAFCRSSAPPPRMAPWP